MYFQLIVHSLFAFIKLASELCLLVGESIPPANFYNYIFA